MYIPVITKIKITNGILVERDLPKPGEITTAVGDKVEPSQKIGSTKVSYKIINLGNKFRLKRGLSFGNTVSKGAVLGSTGIKKFKAPFKGILYKNDLGSCYFKSVSQDYWLLPGVWGEIVDIKEGISVLLKTQTKDMQFVASTPGFVSGELIVFPNPSELLEMEYLNRYLKFASGKIIYVGDCLSPMVLERAAALNVGALLVGSASAHMFDEAKRLKINLGIFSGFGDMKTPSSVYFELNEVSHRYVFFYGDKGKLSIPLPVGTEEPKTKRKVLKFVKKGIDVQIFISKAYGSYGIVDRVTKSSIFVRLENGEDIVEVLPPYIFAIE